MNADAEVLVEDVIIRQECSWDPRGGSVSFNGKRWTRFLSAVSGKSVWDRRKYRRRATSNSPMLGFDNTPFRIDAIPDPHILHGEGREEGMQQWPGSAQTRSGLTSGDLLSNRQSLFLLSNWTTTDKELADFDTSLPRGSVQACSVGASDEICVVAVD
ncbi:uncharacterized protein LY79DRAFT_179115 [Colletotrichum navitas]|uniref:Uncharacterized protein n=1 Tax=Colletotrichum navitas TaxID=681940 RepID=A0AAD8V6D8_9PEZI|nr:uncharacterized protein LY79DRAFT_179115 [Colletotrichum navitas]KAK1593466.1 hypothetical protein LY79DRAFT_179115 [Colletotrichum navitas]